MSSSHTGNKVALAVRLFNIDFNLTQPNTTMHLEEVYPLLPGDRRHRVFENLHHVYTTCQKAQRPSRTEPSWTTEATSVPSGLKIKPRTRPRPPCALGDSLA